MQSLLGPATSGLTSNMPKKDHKKRLVVLFSVILTAFIIWRLLVSWMTPPDQYEVRRTVLHPWITQISSWQYRHFGSIPKGFLFWPTKDKVESAATLLARSTYYELTLEEFSDLTGTKNKVVAGDNHLYLIRSVKYGRSSERSYAYRDSANHFLTLNRFPQPPPKLAGVCNDPFIVESDHPPREVYVAIMGDLFFD